MSEIILNSGIYKITNRVSGKFYIGSAVDFSKRFYMHKNQLNLKKHRNSHLQRAWNRDGADSFDFSVLLRVPKDQLLTAEQKTLDETRATELGYNICQIATNRTGCKHSQETIAKMRLAQMGKRHSEESKAAMSSSKTGVPKPKRTPEHCANIGLAHKGKKVPDEASLKWKKTRAASKYKPSPETLLRMSESMKKTLAAKKVRVDAFLDAAERAAEKEVTRDEINELLLKGI